MRRAVVVRITLRPAAARPAPRPSPIAVVSGRNKAIAAGHQHAKSSSADATAVRFDHGRSHQLAVPHHQLIADVLHAAPKFGPREEKVRVAGLGRAGQLRFRGRGLGAARTHAAAGGRRSNGAGRAPAGGASSAGRRADEAPPAIRNGGGHDDGTTLHALADGRPSARRGESWRGTRPTRAEMTGHASHQSMTEAARVEAFPWLPEHVAAAAVQAEAICIALFDSQRLVASLQKLFVLGRAALLLALLAGAVRSPPDTLFKLIKDAAWLMAASVPVEVEHYAEDLPPFPYNAKYQILCHLLLLLHLLLPLLHFFPVPPLLPPPPAALPLALPPHPSPSSCCSCTLSSSCFPSSSSHPLSPPLPPLPPSTPSSSSSSPVYPFSSFTFTFASPLLLPPFLPAAISLLATLNPPCPPAPAQPAP